MMMKKWKLSVLIMSLGIFSMYGLVGAQQIVPTLIETVAIEVKAEKMPPDERGTDVENIFNFQVAYADAVSRESVYNVLFYLDGNYTAEFKNVKLPYHFSWNFKGQSDKLHEIRVDLEDAQLRIVGRKTVDVNVRHAKRK